MTKFWCDFFRNSNKLGDEAIMRLGENKKERHWRATLNVYTTE